MAITTQKVLHLIFLKDDGKKTTVRIPDPKEDLEESEVLTAMETLVDQEFLGNRATQVDSAKLVETTTELLDVEITEE